MVDGGQVGTKYGMSHKKVTVYGRTYTRRSTRTYLHVHPYMHPSVYYMPLWKNMAL